MAIWNCRDEPTSDFLAGKRVREFEACAGAAARALTRLQAEVRLEAITPLVVEAAD